MYEPGRALFMSRTRVRNVHGRTRKAVIEVSPRELSYAPCGEQRTGWDQVSGRKTLPGLAIPSMFPPPPPPGKRAWSIIRYKKVYDEKKENGKSTIIDGNKICFFDSFDFYFQIDTIHIVPLILKHPRSYIYTSIRGRESKTSLRPRASNFRSRLLRSSHEGGGGFYRSS